MNLKTVFKSFWLSTLSFFLIAGVLYGATTIGSNITTAGTLSVTDTSTLTGAVTMGSTLGVTGTLTASGLMKLAPGYSLDANSAGAIGIGTTTATTINIGGTQATTKVLGLFQVPAAYGLDVADAGTLNIGTTTATTINIGRDAATTTINGHLSSAQATAPVVTNTNGSSISCTGGNGVGSCTDTRGQARSTTAADTNPVVVTFNRAYDVAPVCVISAGSATTQTDFASATIKPVATVSTTALTITPAANWNATAKIINYVCME